MITDLKMPGLDGMGLLKKLSADYPDVPVVMITAHGSVENAVEAVKLGAFDYLEKPFEQEQIRQVVAKAMNTYALARRDARPEEPARARALPPGRPVAGHPADLRASSRRWPTRRRRSSSRGESGTGKELIARALHENSSRHAGPFIKINCAAIPKTLMESELFGYDKGAFTGAVGAKPGRFELAHGGTLFLDEIGEIPVEMQVKLLRVLQESEFERVGGIKTIKVDVRLVTATNRDLLHEVAAGGVPRGSLLPAERRAHPHPAAARAARGHPAAGRPLHREVQRAPEESRSPRITPEAIERLVAYHWPGNIRELENLMERTMLFCEGPEIRVSDLPPEVGRRAAPRRPRPGPPARPRRRRGGRPRRPPSSLKEAVRAETERVERELIQRALDETGGNVTQAARKLKISRKSLQTKMKEFGLREQDQAV